jgi:hypothetical protein
VTAAAGAALDAVKAFLGIGSPSKVTAEVIGEPFVLGISEGINHALGDLKKVELGKLLGAVNINNVWAQANQPQQVSSQASKPAGARSYNLNIYTSASTESIISDYAMMEAMLP